MKRAPLLGSASVLFMLFAPAQAHRDGCHRWHSCPSDSGSYVCGDLGYTSGCPQNGASASVAASTPRPITDGSGALRTTKTNLNLRAGPSAETAKVATLSAGTRVNLMGCGAGWCKVRTQGRVGDVAQQYLR